jgi:hypothetical protein
MLREEVDGQLDLWQPRFRQEALERLKRLGYVVENLSEATSYKG